MKFLNKINKINKLDKFKSDFEIYKSNQNLIYFDSACVTLKPKCVVDKICEYYNEYPVCSGRSTHFLGIQAQNEVDQARKRIQKFFGAKNKEEVIFTRNTTEAINIVASSFNFEKDKYILITDKEHNSNFLPWVRLEEQKKTKLKIIETNCKDLDLKEFEKFMKKNKVQLVAINYISNVDGNINPVEKIIQIAHKYNSLVLLDAAQAAGHIKIDVRKLDVDFMCISGHKMLGPSGIGVLYAKKEILENMNPNLIGGDTVSDVNYPKYSYLPLPNKFEAGLQNYSGMVGLGEATIYLNKNFKELHNRVKENLNYLFKELKDLPIDIISKKENNCGIFTFIPNNLDSIELSLILDEFKICTRAGAFCVHNWFNKYKKQHAIRISLNIYNTKEDCIKLVGVLKNIV
ncbi:MAG: aminotransferase class V-fold PLP-dependent enzyme [Candidatus Woesearchaeota archaeon]|jgi:cysteine desulfurase/selenocysteine lyase|nr:aminotransferase class V-fold PLP-dependent enzyme [Candidatus Woesearchaeota archaeon]